MIEPPSVPIQSQPRQSDPTRVRHVFELADIQKSSHTDVRFATVSTTDVQFTRPLAEGELATRLHAWSLTVLTSGSYELGLYSATCDMINPDDEDDILGTLACIYLCWDGRAELAYGTW